MKAQGVKNRRTLSAADEGTPAIDGAVVVLDTFVLVKMEFWVVEIDSAVVEPPTGFGMATEVGPESSQLLKRPPQVVLLLPMVVRRDELVPHWPVL